MGKVSYPFVTIPGMCMMCDGATPDEMRFMVYGHIEKYGWHIVYVENQKRSASWAYTIGLSSRFGHPELAVVGVGMALR